MLPLCSILSFVLFNAGLVGSSRLAMSAELVPQSFDLVHRAERTGGGWSLSAATCPYGTSKCDIGSWCCPSSFICMNSGDAIAEVCCPGDLRNDQFPEDDCVGPFELNPFCADVSWSLWNATEYFTGYDYFCCLPGQVGLQNGECTSIIQAIPSTSTAVLVFSSTVTTATSTTSIKISMTSSSSALIEKHTTSGMNTTSSLTLSSISTIETSTEASSIVSTTASTSQNIGGVITTASAKTSATAVAPSTSNSERIRMGGQNTGILQAALVLLVVFHVGSF